MIKADRRDVSAAIDTASVPDRSRLRRVCLCLALAMAFATGGCGSEYVAPSAPDASASDTWMSPLPALPGALLSVFAARPGEIWLAGAVGDSTEGPMLWRGTAQGWQQLVVGGTADLWWVAGAGPDHMVAVGAQGTMLVVERETLRGWRIDTGTDATLFGVWAASLDRVVVVGGHVHPQKGPAVMLEVDAREAVASVVSVELAASALPGDPLFKVWGDGAGRMWAVGHRGVVMRRNGDGPWGAEALPDSPRLVTIHGDGSTLFGVGGSQRAVVVRSSDGGDTWVDDSPGDYAGLSGVAVGAEGQVLACGVLGTALERQAGGWSAIDLPLGADWHGAAIDDQGARWLVGGNLASGALNGGRVLVQGGWVPPDVLAPRDLQISAVVIPDGSEVVEGTLDVPEDSYGDFDAADDAADMGPTDDVAAEVADAEVDVPADVLGEVSFDVPSDVPPDVPSDVPSDVPADFVLTLGSVDGSFNFYPFASGGSAEIVQGSQGGIHLDVALSVLLPDASGASTSVSLDARTFIDGVEVGSRVLESLDLIQVAAGTYQSGSTLVIFDTDLADPYVGETAVVEVLVTWQDQQAFASTTLQLVDQF